MDTIQNYKCPCCGASLAFDSKSQHLHCDSCGNDFSAETLEQLDHANTKADEASHFDWDQYEPREFEAVEDDKIASYTCPSCGAEISGDASMGATVCPYCGNATIIKGQFEGALLPDFLIPFKKDKKAAMAAFEESCKKAPFLPDEFKNKKKIEEMAGIYIPFWTFDCECEAAVNYRAEKITTWSDSDSDYTQTDYYQLLREGSIEFQNIPVDASKKADDNYMDAIEPYDYSEAVDFKTTYLSGYLADKYDVSVEDSVERANRRVKNSTEMAFMSTASSYSGVTTENSSINVSHGKIRYSLLPVWMLNIKYAGKVYKYAINGQTGKVVGDYPISKRKRNWYFTKVLAISLAAMLGVAWIYLKLI